MYNQVQPISIQSISNFIAYLHIQNLSGSTIRSIISALNYTHRLSGGFDISQSFLIQKLFTGLRKMAPTCDNRLPISDSILVKLCSALQHMDLCPYRILLFQSMFKLAFYGFLRVGEITVNSTTKINPNLLRLSSIAINQQSMKVSISFFAYKHKSTMQPFVLDIQSDLSEGSLLITLLRYLSLRGFVAGPLFILKSGPITRSNFNGVLARALVFIGLDTDRFKSHSFRIGAATHSFLKGFSTQHIQLMGRWKSNAFAKYLRVQSFSA